MKQLKELKEIYTNLNNGIKYGKMYTYGFSYNLTLSLNGKYICWQHYGSSANKNTLKELAWVIETIFKTTPREFIETHIKYMDGKEVK